MTSSFLKHAHAQTHSFKHPLSIGASASSKTNLCRPVEATHSSHLEDNSGTTPRFTFKNEPTYDCILQRLKNYSCCQVKCNSVSQTPCSFSSGLLRYYNLNKKGQEGRGNGCDAHIHTHTQKKNESGFCTRLRCIEGAELAIQ